MTVLGSLPADPVRPPPPADFPRLRYMGSKYRLVPVLSTVFADVGGTTAIDAFSGSGVVSFLLKTMGVTTTSNDFLSFPSVIARATVQNQGTRLEPELVDAICGPPLDDRDFIARTFDGLYFDADDRAFLDSAWSHIDGLDGRRHDLAVAALVLASARKQPRGVFTFTDSSRYADGRRFLRMSLREHFGECVDAYNRVVFADGLPHTVHQGDVFDLDTGPADLVYLDPPYAPPRDDNDYIKRYHFLEGLSQYWRGARIMEQTRTKKLEKRFTPFAYKRTIEDALDRTFAHFASSGAIVLSYSTNAVPDADRVVDILSSHRRVVSTLAVDHTYSFGTHRTARRRGVSELVFVGRD